MDEIILNDPVVFIWNESENYIEQIVICGEDLALDINKQYEIVFREIKE